MISFIQESGPDDIPIHLSDQFEASNITTAYEGHVYGHGAGVPTGLSGCRVHVYSNCTFTERMLLDAYITKCTYLFKIFYLKLIQSPHAC